MNNNSDELLKIVIENFNNRQNESNQQIKQLDDKKEDRLDYTDIISIANNMVNKAYLFDDLYDLLKLSNSLPSAELKYKVLDKVLKKAYDTQSDFNYYKIAKLLYEDYIIYHTSENIQFIYTIICESKKMWDNAKVKDEYYDWESFAFGRITNFKLMIEKKVNK